MTIVIERNKRYVRFCHTPLTRRAFDILRLYNEEPKDDYRVSVQYGPWEKADDYAKALGVEKFRTHLVSIHDVRSSNWFHVSTSRHWTKDAKPSMSRDAVCRNERSCRAVSFSLAATAF